VVYAVCKCARRFNPSPRHIKELVSLKSGRLSVNLMFMECRLVSPKFRVFRKIAVNRVHVDFVKVQLVFLVLLKFGGVFIKLPSVVCVSISLKFRG